VGLASQLSVAVPIVVFCIGVGLVRRDHRAIGAGLVGAAVVGAVVLALFSTPRPLIGLIAIAGFAFGLEIDQPGVPRRRALGLLGLTVGMFALLIGALYA
jgi:hypothetical protein